MSGFDHARSFGARAEGYARHRPTYPPELFAWLAEIAPTRALAVDVASGSGQGARGLADHFDRVLALDHSPELLAGIPVHPRVTTQVADARALDASGADLVAVFQALHWFAEPAFFARVAAALRPGGVFAVVSYVWFYVDPLVDEAISGHLLPTLEPHWSPRNHLLFDAYRGVDIPFPEIGAVPSFDLSLAWTRRQLVDYLRTWSAVSRMQEVEGRDVLAEFEPGLRAAWPDEAEVRPVRMPLSVRVFRC